MVAWPSGGDHPVGRNSLTAGQLDAYGRVALHEDSFDLGS
jgi:hypothetical protein